MRVLLSEQNPAVAEYLSKLLADAGMEVVSVARGGRETIEQVQCLAPDILVMDLDLPDMDGAETTAVIMQTAALPIVVMTDTSKGARGAEMAFLAMKAGALAAVTRPDPSEQKERGHREHELLNTVRLMSEVKVVTRRARKSSSYQQEEMAATGPEVPVIAIGVSTGGPPVLQTILSQLPPNFPAALLIVQHISAGFLESLQQWLQQTTHFPVIIPTQGAPLRPGCAYLAPDNRHMGVTARGTIELSSAPPENGLRPAASYLFRSVTRVYGSRTCGILLTGMGTDGAAELKAMRTSGGITIVQDRESSVIFGMPGRAIELDAALHIYTPEQIAGALPGIVERMHRSQTEE